MSLASGMADDKILEEKKLMERLACCVSISEDRYHLIKL